MDHGFVVSKFLAMTNSRGADSKGKNGKASVKSSPNNAKNFSQQEKTL